MLQNLTAILKTGKRKIVSTITAAAVFLTAIPTVSVPVAAQNTDTGNSWVGSTKFDYEDEVAEGAGWTWTNDGTTATLTLSGVSATSTTADVSAIQISGDATLVLNGTNKLLFTPTGEYDVGNGLLCIGDLIIKGSGVLDTTSGSAAGYGISLYNGATDTLGDLTIESGYINTESMGAYAAGISAGVLTVNGGYIDSLGACAGIAVTSFEQYGGYVKAYGNDTNLNNGLQASSSITIYSGYLEASAGNAIYASSFTNAGGVVKATSVSLDADSYAINCTAAFSNGVTILNTASANKAIAGAISGLTSEGESFMIIQRRPPLYSRVAAMTALRV